jgi:hypothetical protein
MIKIYNMDEIKDEMETYVTPPTDFPGADETEEELDLSE